jgi:chemotaxis protein methyltransferase CheR
LIQLQPAELKPIADYIYSISAIKLDDTKGYLINSRLGDMVRELGCRTFSQLVAKSQADFSGAVRKRIIDAITTGEPLFFRDAAPFELLRHKLLPDLIDRLGREGVALFRSASGVRRARLARKSIASRSW